MVNLPLLKKKFALFLLVGGLFFALFALNFETVKADTTVTFSSSGSLDGYIVRQNNELPGSHPPEDEYKHMPSAIEVGQNYVSTEYFMFRGFITFDTSSIPADATVSSATLNVTMGSDQSDTDFNVLVFSGQDAWSSSSNLAWISCSGYVGDLGSTSGWSGQKTIAVDASNITKTGKTQFRLMSNREDTAPTGQEFIILTNAKLHVTYTGSDATAPTYSNIDSNSTIVGYPCDFTIDCEDDAELSHAILSTNVTDSWVNETAVSLSGTSDTASDVVTLPSANGQVVGWKWFLNDTTNNWNSTSIQTLTTSDESEAYDYSISFSDQKVYVQLVYSGTAVEVVSENCTFEGEVELTNSTGWAEYDLSELSSFSYNSSAYPTDYSSNTLTIPLAKAYLVIEAVNVSNSLTSISWVSNKFYWTSTGTGATSYKIYSVDAPYYLKIDGQVKLEGDHWSKSGSVITVTDTLSSHDYILSFSPLESPPTGPGGNGSSDDEDESPFEQFATGVTKTTKAVGSRITSNVFSMLILLFLGIGAGVTYSLDYQTWTFCCVFAFIVFSVNFLFSYVLLPLRLVPDWGIPFWTPPTLELSAYSLAFQEIIQVIVVSSLVLATLIGVSVMVWTRD